jgi:hypothetical protein
MTHPIGTLLVKVNPFRGKFARLILFAALACSMLAPRSLANGNWTTSGVQIVNPSNGQFIISASTGMGLRPQATYTKDYYLYRL